MSRSLSEPERAALLRLARAALEQELRADGSLDRALVATDLTPPLHEPRGVFVSLKQPARQGPERLRGCIGYMGSREPLYRSVIDVARKSALEDPRFSPLAADELPGVRIEISALTPMRPVAGPEAIVVGRHGVQLVQGARRAVFLPQVAPEHGWDRAALLEHLARKAGLPADGWRGGQFSVFEAEVFGEPKRRG